MRAQLRLLCYLRACGYRGTAFPFPNVTRLGRAARANGGGGGRDEDDDAGDDDATFAGAPAVAEADTEVHALYADATTVCESALAMMFEFLAGEAAERGCAQCRSVLLALSLAPVPTVTVTVAAATHARQAAAHARAIGRELSGPARGAHATNHMVGLAPCHVGRGLHLLRYHASGLERIHGGVATLCGASTRGVECEATVCTAFVDLRVRGWTGLRPAARALRRW